jgi:hypothetical protein
MWTSSIALFALAFGLAAVPVWSASDCASADRSCAASSVAKPSMDSQQASKATQGGNFIQKKKTRQTFNTKQTKCKATLSTIPTMMSQVLAPFISFLRWYISPIFANDRIAESVEFAFSGRCFS